MRIHNLILGFLISIIAAGCNNKADTRLTEDSVTRRKMTEDSLASVKGLHMKGFMGNIEKVTRENNLFRKVLYTGKHLQLVLMSLKPGEEIGAEIHADHDQFFRFESGKGKCIVNDTVYNIADGDVIIVPAGARHNVINTGTVDDLKFYTLYGPPNHQDGVIRASKKEAELNDESFDGRTTE